MRNRTNKEVLTTGDIARICKVAPRTVAKWFDSGELHGYRIPGSRDRRIPMKELVQFMRAHGLPLECLSEGVTRMVVLDPRAEADRLWNRCVEGHSAVELHIVATAFEAGFQIAHLAPDIVFLDANVLGLSELEDAVRVVAPMEKSHIRVFAFGSSCRAEDVERLRASGLQGWVEKPIDPVIVGRLVGMK